MVQQNQNSANSAETAIFPAENLQEIENGVNFAPSKDYRSKLLYYDPMSDFGFKKIFGKEKVMKAFLNDLLEQESPITKVIFKDKEMLPATEEERKAIFDLRCETEDGTEFIVEMQRLKHRFFTDRIMYYLSRAVELADSEEEKQEKKSYRIKRVYGIFLMNFNLTELQRQTIRKIRFAVEGTNEVFNDKIQAYTIEFPDFKNKKESDCLTNMDIWIYNLLAMRTATTPLAFQKRLPIFEDIAKIGDLSKLTKEEYEAYFWECENYHSNMIVWEDNLIMAREEAAAEERRKNAKSLKKNGVPVEVISKSLGLTPEEVEALIAE